MQIFLDFVEPMTVGFLAYAAWKAFRISVHNTITHFIMVISAIATFLSVQNTVDFPDRDCARRFDHQYQQQTYSPERNNDKKNQMGQYLALRFYFYSGGNIE